MTQGQFRHRVDAYIRQGKTEREAIELAAYDEAHPHPLDWERAAEQSLTGDNGGEQQVTTEENSK